MLEWCGDHPIVLDYIPDVIEIRKIPKQWLINMIYSLVGNPFKDLVREQIDSKNQRITVERDLMINLDPRLLQFLQIALPSAVSDNLYF